MMIGAEKSNNILMIDKNKRNKNKLISNKSSVVSNNTKHRSKEKRKNNTNVASSNSVNFWSKSHESSNVEG
jgi:hypothetical protein